jgi:hypothetical protein
MVKRLIERIFAVGIDPGFRVKVVLLTTNLIQELPKSPIGEMLWPTFAFSQ